nr:MAG TPA: hypothetical protein [Caudoviricetes sp.]DAH36535.1 MAG TPA: hypothetical protein [Caudoviricetes sp.]
MDRLHCTWRISNKSDTKKRTTFVVSPFCCTFAKVFY